MADHPVLVSWVAFNNDPYERDRRTSQYRPDVDEQLVPGPTLTLLFDAASPFCNRIRDVVLLGRLAPGDEVSRDRIRETEHAIQKTNGSIRVHSRFWNGQSPTDHRGLFLFLKSRLPEIRQQFPGRELVINLSPGTPAMHAVWILLAETGLVEPPFQIVQTVEPRHRGPSGSATVPVEIGLDTLYKAARASKPAQSSSAEDPAFWDPSRFRSDTLKRTYDEARRYAALNVPILILGERGTGKTTLASWIRAASPFRKPELDGAWPSVPCGQYTSETMRAELFGYKKGAFTGAERDHDGLLHRADGDTLFLDEIGDVSRDLQRLLIRAIEDGSYTPLGSPERRSSNFRLVTATNVPLPELRERVDPDFFDRISPLMLRVPPLRDIAGDLEWIWRGVWAEAASRACVHDVDRPEDDHERIVRHLQAHPLPGNVRDLYRVAYQLLAHPDGVLDALVSDALRSDELPGTTVEGSPVAATLRACADGAELDAVYDAHGVIPAKATLAAVQHYISTEARALAHRRRLRADDVTDVTDRTLLNWKLV